jgi:tetratricopeptide (TPR) repeat protein
LAIGALVLLFLSMLGGGVGWAARDRATRQARVSGHLELILGEMARLENAEKWSEALAAARRAETALAGGEATPDIEERLLQRLADLELVQRLDDIRARSGTAWGFPSHSRELLEADKEYQTAFREAGIDVDVHPLHETVDWIAARPTIAAALLPALDDWVGVRSAENNEAGTRRLVEALRAADPDPWRQQMREALAREDWVALDKLVESDELDRQSAATLAFLATALRVRGKVAAQRLVLTRAQSKYPADYWINHRLGIDLIWQHSPNDIRNGIGFLRAAVALRPESGHSMMNLGIGYKYLGQLDEAIACYRRAIELQPSSYQSYSNLGNALTETGSHDEAVAAFEQAIKLAPQAVSYSNNLAWLLVNSADAARRDPAKAIELAQRAIQISPDQASHWSTLGAAQYRAGDWRTAIETLKKSEELRPGRSTMCINALFLAMAYWQLGERDTSLQWYGKAVEWMDKQQTEDTQLHRIRAEAEELLQTDNEPPPAKPPADVN